MSELTPHCHPSGDEGAYETEQTARALVASIRRYRDGRGGHPVQLLVLADRATNQTLEARRVYARFGNTRDCAKVAVVCATTFGRAIGSVFLGPYRTEAPLRLFDSVGEALAWLDEAARSTG